MVGSSGYHTDGGNVPGEIGKGGVLYTGSGGTPETESGNAAEGAGPGVGRPGVGRPRGEGIGTFVGGESGGVVGAIGNGAAGTWVPACATTRFSMPRPKKYPLQVKTAVSTINRFKVFIRVDPRKC